MSEKGTISIAFVVEAIEPLAKLGVDRDRLLEDANISPALLNRVDARVSSAVYANLMRAITVALDDEFLGHDSRRMKIGSFAVLCRSVIVCHTLKEALEQTLAFYQLFLDDLNPSLELDSDRCWLILRQRPGSRSSIFAQEMLLMFVHRLACWLANRRVPIQCATFKYIAPEHVSEYALMFGNNFSFEQPFTGIAFGSNFLELPIHRSKADLAEFLSVVPEKLLLRYRDPKSTSSSIAKLIANDRPAHWPTFARLAKLLSLSESTLRRRLESEGVSYQLIKDNIRRDMAINLLSDTMRNLTDIAAQLGFAEPSAFHRAFKKWTGATPGDYRRTMSNPDASHFAKS